MPGYFPTTASAGNPGLTLQYSAVMQGLEKVFPKMTSKPLPNGVPALVGDSRGRHAHLMLLGNKNSVAAILLGRPVRLHRVQDDANRCLKLMIRLVENSSPGGADQAALASVAGDMLIEVMREPRLGHVGREVVLFSVTVVKREIDSRVITLDLKKGGLFFTIQATPVTESATPRSSTESQVEDAASSDDLSPPAPSRESEKFRLVGDSMAFYTLVTHRDLFVTGVTGPGDRKERMDAAMARGIKAGRVVELRKGTEITLTEKATSILSEVIQPGRPSKWWLPNDDLKRANVPIPPVDHEYVSEQLRSAE